jgi:hypothetical protein
MPVKRTTQAKTKPKVAEPKPKVAEPELFLCVIAVMVHPFQNVRFNPGQPVPCKMDSWLKSQISAGLIKPAK